MKFVMLVKATKASEAGVMPSEEDPAEVRAYNRELVRAGVMRDGVGLSPTAEASGSGTPSTRDLVGNNLDQNGGRGGRQPNVWSSTVGT